MIDELQTGLAGLREDISGFIAEQPLKAAAIGVGGAGLVTGAVLGGGAIIKSIKKKRRKTKKTVRKSKRTSKRKTGRRLKFGSPAWRKKYIGKGKRKTQAQRRATHKKRYGTTKLPRRKYKYARTAGRGRDTSTRRIRQTKNGQPYIILANGRARFIKRTSARRSRKLKGGKY